MEANYPVQWIQQIEKAESILLISHVNPDGDTIGSVLGLRLALLSMGKQVTCVCDGSIPRNMSILEGSDTYLMPDQVDVSYDTAIAVDVSSPEMMGESRKLFDRAKVKMVLDHHATNPAFGEFNFIRGGEAACCQLVYEVVLALHQEITPEMADCILTGLSTDTGHFQYASTTPLTLDTAADLVHHGANISRISRAMYRSEPMQRIELIRIVYQKMKFFFDGQVGMVELSKNDFEKAGCNPTETDGLVNIPLEVEGVRFSFLASEREKGIKISLRATEPDSIMDVALQFGGGGHKQAAGCTIHESLETASRMVLEAIEKKL